ncbi:MAG: LysR family transcriptional regulator [Rhodospirillaceae bacterium]|jgi:DNA-binding transcriptional LysR family regulator|nr:LysR family transcriptional regulator [Rhodospirillaceae bacterium]MBT4589108.1 LysR family transcriptional regulator [Rhodospirillaceae bacterium]MBT4940884.1 LysR family transcriptional regulator [Rhodospirillaceae bacterium]MBT5938602.1 LysR family transcriptional regulator [Rhodospirillaceae bacterium]MBT7266174.1 LysR family transcriptional regulator [Rhodospirillaceae bacterium]
MNKIDYLDIDGRILRMFVLVYDEGSVTKAAERLGITQSAVSHGLEKLRTIMGDPLFVRAGRGITPTHNADAIIDEVRLLLRDMRSLSEQRKFDLATVSGQFVVAANDIYWGTLLGPVYAQITAEAPELNFRVIQSGIDAAAVLRNEECDLVVTPLLPEGSEFKQQKIFTDKFVCFYDPDVTSAPKTLEDYLSRRHARIVFGAVDINPIDQILALQGKHRRVTLQVPNFAGLPELMKGTDVIAILPETLKSTFMRDFSRVPSPIAVEPLSIYQVWHQRDDDRPLHRWMRQLIQQTARKI